MKAIPLTAAGALIGLAAVGIWFAKQEGTQPDTSSNLPGVNGAKPSVVDSERVSDSPFVVVDRNTATTDSQVNNGNSERIVTPERSETAPSDSEDIPPWGSPLNEVQLGDIVARLKADSALLQRLVDEFRQESDPARKQRLAMVLGEVGGEQATLLASELIFSGDSDERTLGMDLLQDIQPGNAQARDIVSGMLATEVEPKVLIDAMTALSRPGDVDTSSRAYLSDQLAWLTTHQDDGVRSISLDILSRWSQDGRYTDVIVAGLDDKSQYVRASAAYSLVGHEDSSPVVTERLFGTVRASAEPKSVKRAAILALRSMPLSAAQLVELDALELRLNTVPR